MGMVRNPSHRLTTRGSPGAHENRTLGSCRSARLAVEGPTYPSSTRRLRQALSELGPMRSVALRVASDDRVQFEVDFAGGRSQLIRSVTGVGGLSECEEPAAESPTFCFR